jgi:hypothetical protein
MTTATRIIAACLLLGVAPAHAQTADAETLFKEGKRLMKKGNIAEACKRFEASEKLDPGIGTELNLGDCLDKNHQTASAWAMFIKAAASAKRAGDGKRMNEAKKRSTQLETQLIHLTIDVPEDHREPGLKIERNDVDIDETLWGQPAPVDPDQYTITAQADGYETFTATISVKTKDRHVEIPALDKSPVPVKVEPTPPTEPTHREAPPPPPPPRPETHVRKGPIGLAVFGVAAIGAGVVLGLRSRSDESAADNACPANMAMSLGCINPNGLSQNSNARTEALFANVGFAVGGAAIVGTVIWWAVAGTSSTADRVSLVPTLDAHHGGLAVIGRF